MADPTDQDLRCAADEMVIRFGVRAAMEAALWSNDAMEQGDQTGYEFWQRVSFTITAQGWAKPNLS